MLKKILKLFLFTLVFLILPNFVFAVDKLLQQSDLEYLGAFRGPNYWGGNDCYSLAYGGISMAYNPNHDSLFVSGITQCNNVTEITIPQLVNSSNLSALNGASFANAIPYFFDPTEGNRSNLGAGGATISGSISNRGLLVYGDKLIGTSKVYYDGAYAQRLTHFTHSLELSQSSFAGNFELDVNIFKGVLPGYLGLIPAEYQTLLGGKVITGMGFGSIATASSYGPSVTVFDPDDFNMQTSATAIPLQYYDSAAHSLPGGYYDNNQPANIYTSTGDVVGGVVFPSGTRSVMFFGTHGTSNTDGYACYGIPVATLEQAYTSGPPYLLNNRRHNCGTNQEENCCYNPQGGGKGVNSYPYVNQIWAYDVNDLIAVKNGTKHPWENVPYAVWNPTLPTAGRQIISAAYDPLTRRIFVAQEFADGTSPVFHVFQVNLSGTSDSTPPTAPSGLSVL